jgi:uncharacterized protein (DUF952 family)
VKIMTSSEWATMSADGRLRAGENDTDGFIHLSTVEQLPRTANKWYAGRVGLIAAVVDAEHLGPNLRWEPNAQGELFPHLYGELSTDVVITTVPLQTDDAGEFILPEALKEYDA